MKPMNGAPASTGRTLPRCLCGAADDAPAHGGEISHFRGPLGRQDVPRKMTRRAPGLAVRPAAGHRASASTLTSFAAQAGVSVSTVSKVLNGRTDVAPATRERVGRMLRRHGYQPGASPGFGVVDLPIGKGDCPSPTA